MRSPYMMAIYKFQIIVIFSNWGKPSAVFLLKSIQCWFPNKFDFNFQTFLKIDIIYCFRYINIILHALAVCVYEEFEITAAINQAHFYYKEKKGSYLTATASWNKWQGGQGIMFCNSSNRIWKMEVINNISNRLPILLTSKFYEWYPQFQILDWRQEKSILKYSSRYMNNFFWVDFHLILCIRNHFWLFSI